MMCNHPENMKPEEDKINCMTLNVNKREYYSLSWEEIADAALQDEFLVELKQALLDNNHEKLKNLLKEKRIHCPESKNGLRAIEIEDLTLFKDVILVRDRIWAPAAITYAFFNNLHLGHRAPDMMKWLARRCVYWCGIAKDIEDFYNECHH